MHQFSALTPRYSGEVGSEGARCSPHEQQMLLFFLSQLLLDLTKRIHIDKRLSLRALLQDRSG